MNARLDVALPAGAPCAFHEDRAAARACARCGTFVCQGCTVSGDLCHDCKRILLREGTPWSPAERARAAARVGRRRASFALRTALGLGLAALVATWGSSAGHLPEGAALARGLGGACAVVGVVGATLAGLAWRRSEAGRPGPAVAGVVPALTAATLAALGLAPAVAWGITWVSRTFL